MIINYELIFVVLNGIAMVRATTDVTSSNQDVWHNSKAHDAMGLKLHMYIKCWGLGT